MWGGEGMCCVIGGGVCEAGRVLYRAALHAC